MGRIRLPGLQVASVDGDVSRTVHDADPPGPESVIRISPSAPVLPVNTLRFYLSCERPWEARFERDRLCLRDEDEHVVPHPFLVLSQELWSVDGRRLTVFMDPSRIKRGVARTGPKSSAVDAPALWCGRCFSLEVEALGGTFRRAFRAGEPVSSPLNEARWRVAPPSVGSLDPVYVQFDRVVDEALSETEIAALDPGGNVLATCSTLDANGLIARVAPRHQWSVGTHHLVFSSCFEDVCGNRLGEALDHKLHDIGSPRIGVIAFDPTAPSHRR